MHEALSKADKVYTEMCALLLVCDTAVLQHLFPSVMHKPKYSKLKTDDSVHVELGVRIDLVNRVFCVCHGHTWLTEALRSIWICRSFLNLRKAMLWCSVISSHNTLAYAT